MSLGEALGWKHNHASGIETMDGEITAWPESLGPVPTKAQQNQIVAEYTTFSAKQQSLRDTEDVGAVARKLEEVMDNIVNGTALSQEAVDWLNQRKNIRGAP